ncbi:MAG: CZB domain-containing protein [Pseudomonadota bacterium]
MVQIGHQERLKALDTLLNARRSHTLWVSEVTHQQAPCVVEDHTLCDFGKWLIEAEGILGSVPEFIELREPHQQLHDTYVSLKADPDRALRSSRIRDISRTLIDRIDGLEKYLNRPRRD